MAKALGKAFSVSRDSGTWGAHTFIPLIAAKDIKVAYKPAAVVDGTDRELATPLRRSLTIRHNVEASWNSIWNGGAGMLAIRNACTAGTAIRLAVLNALPTAAGVGFRGDWLVKSMDFKFPLNDAQLIDTVICPHGDYTNAVVAWTDDSVSLGTPETQATKKLGKNGSVNNGSNTPIPAIRSFGFKIEWELCDASDRASDFDFYLPTVQKITADMEFQWNEGNSLLTALRTAWEANTALANYSFMDGPYATSGSWGVKGDWFVTDHPHDSPLADGQECKVKLELAGNYSNAFAFTTI